MNRSRRYIVQALGLSLGIFLATAVAAGPEEQPREYEIELLVFQNLIENDAGEVWPIDYAAWFEEETDQQAPSSPLPHAAVTWLPKSQYRLRAARNVLGRSAQYRPLAWFAWRQPVLDRQRAKAVELSSQDPGSGKAYVEGSARVAVERYLHLYLDLQLHTAVDSLQRESLGYEIAEIRLVEQRRMRSKELHFFDNPRFGVIALITPYEPPQKTPESGLPAPAMQP